MKQSETAHSETHTRMYTHAQQLKFKTTRLHAAHRAIPACVCSLLQLCKHKCQSLCKRANKMALSVYSLLIVLQQCTKKHHCKRHSWHEKTCHGTAGYSTGLKHRSGLNDNISSETFSAENTHLFSMHLLGDGYTTFTCRLQRGSCKVFVWRRSVSNANLHKHQALHEDER